MFREPQPTRYDLNFQVFGVPVRISPIFWLIAVLFGASSSSIAELLNWVFIMLFSILVHELGHSAAMAMYGTSSKIVLYGFGGLAIPTSGYYSRRPIEQIVISLAGPFAGFLVAAVTLVCAALFIESTISVRYILFVLPFPAIFFLEAINPILQDFILTLLIINIFWGYLNLLPVFPLDGGQVAVNAFQIVDPVNGFRTGLWLSVVVGALVAIGAGLFLRSFYIAILFGYMAFNSYQIVQRM